MTTMYCVKCRAKRDDPNAERVTMKNGKPAMKGKCPVCGTAMFKIGGQILIISVRKTPTTFCFGVFQPGFYQPATSPSNMLGIL